jgi:hypothetical protein
MPELDIVADTELRERAIAAAADFVRHHGYPVARSQIAGLLQIAGNEPGRLSDFCGKQRERALRRKETTTRAERQAHYQAEADFWSLVQQLAAGVGAKVPWSLRKLRDSAARPADCTVTPLEAGAKLTREQQAARKETERRARHWEQEWDRDHYPIFVRHFCAEYLHHKPPEK